MKDILTMKEACELFKVGQNSIRKAIKENRIPYRHFSGKYYFSRTALSLWCAGLDIEKMFMHEFEKLEAI